MNQLCSSQLQQVQELYVRLLALDQLLGSVPLQQQQDLDLEAVLSQECSATKWQEAAARSLKELYNVADTVPRFDLIPATLAYICRTSWQGRTYENVYRHSDLNEVRDPTCSEVLKLLPKLDRVLETSLNNKINAIVGLVSPFRFLDLPTEIRLHVYAYVLPRQPYLTLRNVEPRRHTLPCYDLAALRTCRHVHNELIDNFYKDQTLVMNVYDMGDYAWALKKRAPRDRLLVLNMRRETRSCFKRLEIRILDMEDPNIDRPGSYWEAMKEDDIWTSGAYRTCSREVLEAFPNLECATVSFEIEEINLRYWTGWYHALGTIAKALISTIPECIKVRWDFQPTSHPDLQEIAEEEEEIMEEAKRMVSEETAKRGGVVELGKSIIKEHIPRYRPFGGEVF